MPIDEFGQGVSDGTERKIRDFGDIHRFTLGIVRRVIEKKRDDGWRRSQTIFYIDLTAGAGEANGMPGSPMVAIRNLMETGKDWRAKLCEKTDIAAYHLGQRLDDMGEEVRLRSRLFWMDHQLAVDDIIAEIEEERQGGMAFGCIYADPNGTLADKEMDTCRRIVSAHPKLDVLLHIAATTRKRCVTVHGKMALDKWLDTIGKRTLLVREPCRDLQWTFFFLTNFPDFPDWEKRGFFDSNSPEGAEILRRLTLPEREWKSRSMPAKGQMQLW